MDKLSVFLSLLLLPDGGIDQRVAELHLDIHCI